MVDLHDTRLETFSFGDQSEDVFYLLIDIRINPQGIDIEKLSKTDPRILDSVLKEMGCVLMLNGEEIDELVRRGDINEKKKHQSLFELAVGEKLIN